LKLGIPVLLLLAASLGFLARLALAEPVTWLDRNKELIVLAAPLSDDPYYADFFDEIVEFQLAFAKKISAHDRVLVLSDRKSYPRYADQLGEGKVVVAPQDDIWVRDYSPSNAASSTLFRYTSAGQGGGRSGLIDAREVQKTFATWLKSLSFAYAKNFLQNDGGNFVVDGAGNLVVSTKFLHDNHLSRKKARKKRLKVPGIEQVAFIEADEQGGLEHADGVVAFLEPGVLAINSYPDDPDYAANLRADLKAGLPGVQLVELITPYDGSQVYDQRFGSACGLYTNMLVTPLHIYLPQFGIPEDKIAMQQVEAATNKQVIGISSSPVCQMGGGVRCMSWQVHGQEAERLLQALGKSG